MRIKQISMAGCADTRAQKDIIGSTACCKPWANARAILVQCREQEKKRAAYDKILSIHALYFWQEPRRALMEAHRVLKAGGMLALTILPKEKWPGRGNGTELCHVYTGNDVVDLLLDAGFASARVESGPTPEQFREITVIGVK